MVIIVLDETKLTTTEMTEIVDKARFYTNTVVAESFEDALEQLRENDGNLPKT